MFAVVGVGDEGSASGECAPCTKQPLVVIVDECRLPLIVFLYGIDAARLSCERPNGLAPTAEIFTDGEIVKLTGDIFARMRVRVPCRKKLAFEANNV
jgi:hypothetical protein